MSIVETEHVLVVPTELFHELGYFQGFSTDVVRYMDQLLSPQNTSYRPRGEMENDPSYKQLIPYVIFRYKLDTRHELFAYTRGKGQGEQRLHSKVSVGIGGHISIVDSQGDDADPYQEGMRRELAEEVQIDTDYRQRIVGLINDDETEVGRVHLGIVHLFEVDRPDVQPREVDIVDAHFRPFDELLEEVDHMESWSRICVEAYAVEPW